MSALFIVPQFTEIVYAKAVDADTQKNPTKCNMAEDNYEIDSGGWYEFTGETVSNYIEVSSKETAYIILNNVKIDTEAGETHPAIDICNGSKAVILLEGKNYLHGGKKDGIFETDDGYAGIRVTSDSEVTITTLNPGGSLEAVGWQGKRGAAIGAGANNSMIAGGMGDIKIVNCYIDNRTAADRYAPTIGAGRDSDLNDIEITNSYVKGAGIGSGWGTSAGNITISNSNVTAGGSEIKHKTYYA